MSVGLAYGQSDKTYVRQGNKLYQSDDFANAEIDYRKALDKNPNSLSGTFNLADALYAQEDYEKSGELFDKIGKADILKEQKAMAYYNLGNSLVKAKQYEGAVESYKMALRNNPTDEQARYNLEYARKMLAQQNKENQDQKDKQKDQNKDQDQKKDKPEDKKNQEDQKKDQNDQEQNQEKPQDNKDNQGESEQQMNDQQSKQISKKDAERMLEALKNNEKKTLEKLKKGKKAKVRVVKKEKDW